MKISIITINWNNADGLERTIKSVVGQTYDNIEYIVIDGGSSDRSVDVIKKYADKITYWISERDNGIYNAMNKGAKQASGDYCLFLNSGDVLLTDKSISKITSSYDFYADIISCDLFSDNIYSNSPDKKPNAVNFIIHNYIYHPSTFIKTSIIQSIPYHENYKISSDWFFFFETLIINNCTYQHIPIPLTIFYTDGISNSKQSIIGLKEGENYFNKYINKAIINNINIIDRDKEHLILLANKKLSKCGYKILCFIYKLLLKFDYLITKPLISLYQRIKHNYKKH